MKVTVKKREASKSCEYCRLEPITVCGDCDREYIMIDVRFYRALKLGKFKLKKPIRSLERGSE
jgi:hypothetical protein